MVAYLHFGNGETPESSGLKGDHLAGKYYVRFDVEYKNQIKELINKGQSEEEAKRMLPSYSKLRKCFANGKPETNPWFHFGSR